MTEEAVEITEAGRLDMYQRLEGAIGHGAATMLMAHLPPGGWGAVATKRDLADVRTEMAAMAKEMATKAELGELRTEMRVGFADLRTEIATSQRQLLQHLLFALVASNATLVGLVFAAVKLG